MSDSKKKIINRLRTIKGHIAGIEKSVKHAAQQIFEQDALSKIKLPEFLAIPCQT